eukprot:3030799-Rhodomonas_salina.1
MPRGAVVCRMAVSTDTRLNACDAMLLFQRKRNRHLLPISRPRFDLASPTPPPLDPQPSNSLEWASAVRLAVRGRRGPAGGGRASRALDPTPTALAHSSSPPARSSASPILRAPPPPPPLGPRSRPPPF